MTIAEKAPVRTIDELLAEGRRILAEKAARDEKQRERERAERRDSWLALRARAREDLGELADDLPIEPPEDFCEQSKEHRAEFRPFGAAPLYVHFRCDSVDGWYLWQKAFTIGVNFGLEWLEDGGQALWIVTWCTHPTDSLAEALALCDAATEPYLAATKEAETKPPPQPKALPAELKLTEPERKLIEALRGLLF